MMNFAVVGEEEMNRLKKRTQIERMTVAKTLVQSVLDEVREGVIEDVTDLQVLASDIKELGFDLKINVMHRTIRELKDG